MDIKIKYAPNTVANILNNNLVEVFCYDNNASFWTEGCFLNCSWNGGEVKIKVLGGLTESHIQEVLNLASEASWENVQNQQLTV